SAQKAPSGVSEWRKTSRSSGPTSSRLRVFISALALTGSACCSHSSTTLASGYSAPPPGLHFQGLSFPVNKEVPTLQINIRVIEHTSQCRGYKDKENGARITTLPLQPHALRIPDTGHSGRDDDPLRCELDAVSGTPVPRDGGHAQSTAARPVAYFAVNPRYGLAKRPQAV